MPIPDFMEIEIKTDLTHELVFGSESVVLFGERIEVTSEDGTKVFSEKLGKIKKAWVDEGIGIGKLVVLTHSDEEREIAYFSKKKSGNFGRFAGTINNYLKTGKLLQPDFLPEGKRRGSKVGTLLWLFRFASGYKRELFIGMILSLIITGLALVPPYLLKVLIDNVLTTNTHSIPLFEELTAVLFLSYLAITLMSIGQSYILNSTGQKIINELRSKTFRHVMGLSQSFIDRFPTGRVLSRLTSDAGNTNWLMVWGIPTVMTNLLTIVGTGIILFGMYPALAIYVLIPVPFVIVAIYFYRRKSQRIYHKNWRRSADVTSNIADIIPNYPIIKASAKEDFEGANLDSLLDELYNAAMGITTLNLTYFPAIGFIATIATIVIWWQGGNLVIGGVIQIGVITAFVAYTALLYGPVNNLGNVIPFIQQGITSGDRLREILETEPDIAKQENPKKPSLDNDISFEHVGFGYTPFDPLIDDLNFKIKKGSRIAIVGRSGSGKSTISKLILRFYDVNSGSIKIGGIDIKEIDTKHLREKIAYVPQDLSLFENSVEYNIRYGTTLRAGEKDVIIAAKVADIHDDMMKLDLAYDTFLGEKGMSLSGGQRQKIAIARAMIKKPDMIILDECTSNLDVVSEMQVYNAINNLTRGKTAIFITHNPNEVVNLDEVMVMKEGRMVEHGKTNALLAKKGEFYRMFKSHNKEFGKMKFGFKKKIDAKEYTSKFTDAGKIIALRNKKGSRVDLHVNGKVLEGLKPRLAFPISAAKFVVFYAKNGEELVIVEDYTKIRGDTNALYEAIAKNNFKLGIIKVHSIKIAGDEMEWDVDTTRGRSIINTAGRVSIKAKEGMLLIIDVYGMIYESNLNKLDRQSYQLVTQTI